MMDIYLIALGIITLAIATLTDIFYDRTIPDTISIIMVAGGICLRLIYSIQADNYVWLFGGLLGTLICYTTGYILFNIDSWGGGDAKLFAGIGAIVGVDMVLFSNLLVFIISLTVIGSAYYAVFKWLIGKYKWGKTYEIPFVPCIFLSFISMVAVAVV